MRILVLNGVNMNVLGRRDPKLYGGWSIGELESQIYQWARDVNSSAQCKQTNNEGDYSYAIRDALELFEAPIVEVHLSNVDDREDWRGISVISDLVAHRIVGKGPMGYKEAIEWLSQNE